MKDNTFLQLLLLVQFAHAAADCIYKTIACIDDGHGPDDHLNLLIEVTGEKKKDKAAKVSTARTLWVPAINNHGGFGRWKFLEVADPWDAKNAIQTFIRGKAKAVAV